MIAVVSLTLTLSLVMIFTESLIIGTAIGTTAAFAILTLSLKKGERKEQPGGIRGRIKTTKGEMKKNSVDNREENR